jgi:sarcosine oxidase subunit gamma
MADPVTALGGREAKGVVTVRDVGLQGMITLRGDLASSKLKSVCKALTGKPIPDMGRIVSADGKGLAWMSPDELLLLVPYADVVASLQQIAGAMKGQHHLAVDVSDARALIEVRGGHAREVIAKLAPVDLHPAHFGPGQFRRSHLGQVAAAFWIDDSGAFRVICFRSVAEYAFDLLVDAAKAGPVGYF